MGILQLGEVVTICDHLIPLPARELKNEIEGKPLVIALHLLVELFRRNPIELSQVCINQDFVAPDYENALRYARGRYRISRDISALDLLLQVLKWFLAMKRRSSNPG
jgi:hypothetical protein